MTDSDGTTTCRSCGRQTQNRARWAPAIINGTVVGYTCVGCPKHGEPITRYVNGAGVRFWVRLTKGTTATGKQMWDTKVFSSLSDARRWKERRAVELKDQRGHGVPLDRDHTTLDALCDEWLEYQRGRVREVSREFYGHALKPVRRRLGNRKVQTLTYLDIERLATWLLREGGRKGHPLGRRAARASLSAMVRALDRAVRVHGVIAANPAHGVTLPSIEHHDEVELERWTADQLVKFTRHTDDDGHAVAWRLLALGMRREEVLGLDWSAIDFDAGTIAVQQTRVRVSKATDPKGWMLGKPKSAASRRTIRPDDVQPDTMRALKELHLAAGRPSRGLVVLDGFGDPVEPNWFSRRFAVLCADAGVPVINVHSTRHTIAYLLHDAGVPPVRAAAFLGHRADVHLRVYLFAREEDVATAGSALGRVLSSAASGA